MLETPAVVGDVGDIEIPGHGGGEVLSGNGGLRPQVVGIDAGSGRHTPYPDGVVAGRDDARHGGAVSPERVVHIILAGEVVVAGGHYVGRQILVGVLQAVIHQRHVHARTQVPAGPDLLDPDVPHRPAPELARVFQVPLAPVQGVVVVGRQAGA